MSRPRVVGALAGDVLVEASRRGVLWLYLLASGALAVAIAAAADLQVLFVEAAPAPAAWPARLALGASGVAPGSLRVAARSPRGAALLLDEGDGVLRRDRRAVGRIDYAAGEATLERAAVEDLLPAPGAPAPGGPTAPGAPAGAGTSPGGAAAPPAAPGAPGAHDVTLEVRVGVSLAGLDRAARAEAVATGHGARLTLFGNALEREREELPARWAAPLAWTTYLYFLLVWPGGAFLGVFLGLLAVAGAVPSAFGPEQAELLLSRPVSRADVVLGRALGALAFGALQAVWPLALAVGVAGLRTGVWPYPVLFAAGPLVLKFAVLLALAHLVGLALRHAALGVAASLVLWALATAVHLAPRDAGQGLPLDARALVWVDRAVPQVAALDVTGRALAGLHVDAPAPWAPAAQCAAWWAALVAATVGVAWRRDA